MTDKLIPLKIAGVGYSLPETVITNDDLTKLYETSDEWIYTRTGIKERRVVSGEQNAVDLGLEASQKALEKANMSPDEIDLIIAASSAPPDLYPAIACHIHERLGIKKQIPAFDITAACSGLIYAMSIAKAYISSGMYKNILLVATDNNSRLVDWTDRGTSILFGDGAGAMVLTPSDDGLDDIIAIDITADGNFGHLIELPFDGKNCPLVEPNEKREAVIKMNGRGVYTFVAKVQLINGGDYGYATVTENTTRPTYGNALGRFIYISGTQVAKDYNTVLNGGKIYYLHFGYYKNASISFGDDKFTINSINITTNDSELYHTEIETNLDGQAITQVPFGKYKVTELVAPEGYWLNEEPITIEFKQDGVKEFNIPNERKGKVVVHHYIKGTTTKLAEDEVIEGKNGEKYISLPQISLEKYELEKDENGEYIIPSNAVGTYTSEDIVVTYYYVKKSIPLVVKHYIEGTEMSVPLADGSLAEDEIYSGQEGEDNLKTKVDESSSASKDERKQYLQSLGGQY